MENTVGGFLRKFKINNAVTNNCEAKNKKTVSLFSDIQ